MKTKKYLLAGVLILSLSTPAIAQDDSYKAALNPIISAMEAAPNDPKAGKDLIKDYMKMYKKNEKALIALGNIYLAQHNYDEASKIANQVVNNKKMNGSEGYLLLGDIAALQDSIGNAGAAATQYQTAISLDPHNVQAYERYAKVYRHVNADVAVQKLEELRKVEPNYPVEATAAEIMLNDGKYAEALAWFDKAQLSNMSEDNFSFRMQRPCLLAMARRLPTTMQFTARRYVATSSSTSRSQTLRRQWRWTRKILSH